jgi:hypothetical protein
MKHVKSFVIFLNEEAEGHNGKGTFTVNSRSQNNLFLLIADQLKDGVWKRDKPQDHWSPWVISKITYDESNPGRNFPVKKDDYDLGILLSYIKDRMLVFGAAGSARWNLAISNEEKLAVEDFFANLTDLERICRTQDFENYYQNYLNKDTRRDLLAIIEKNKYRLKDIWKEIGSGRYGISMLKNDLTEIADAMKIRKYFFSKNYAGAGA